MKLLPCIRSTRIRDEACAGPCTESGSVTMMNIITLTLSPAFDVHCRGNLILAHENLVHMTACQAGGKGINISRALIRNGCPNRSLVVLGEENADGFLKNLSADGLDYTAIFTPGRIRENITIRAEDGTETRISFPGFAAQPGLLDRISASLLSEADSETVITMTGRVPEGIEVVQVKEMLHRAKGRGARIVVDSRSFTLEDLLDLKPWLIKPNKEEIAAYLGREVRCLQETCREAKMLHEAGIANVMISMGAEGALLVCDEGIFLAIPPKVTVLSTIGAGDSSIAGFLSAAADGCNGEKRLARAVAYGTAACMTQGTEPPGKEDVQRIEPLVRLQYR